VIYLSLFTISFLAATILPFSSELTLAGLIATSNFDNLLLLIVASFGNIFVYLNSISSENFDLMRNILTNDFGENCYKAINLKIL
jgi:hypothetical protein